METKITATNLARSLSDILSRVRYRGESFLVERGGEPVATIRPVGPSLGVTGRDLASRLRGISMPGDGFADDLEAVQASQPRVGLPSWDS